MTATWQTLISFSNAGWITVKAEGVTLQPVLKKCWKFRVSLVCFSPSSRRGNTNSSSWLCGLSGGLWAELVTCWSSCNRTGGTTTKKHKHTHMGEVTYSAARGSALPTLFCLHINEKVISDCEISLDEWDYFQAVSSVMGVIFGHILLHVTHPQSHCCRSDQAGPTSEGWISYTRYVSVASLTPTLGVTQSWTKVKEVVLASDQSVIDKCAGSRAADFTEEDQNTLWVCGRIWLLPLYNIKLMCSFLFLSSVWFNTLRIKNKYKTVYNNLYSANTLTAHWTSLENMKKGSHFGL